jgi:hypothetical protein
MAASRVEEAPAMISAVLRWRGNKALAVTMLSFSPIQAT